MKPQAETSHVKPVLSVNIEQERDLVTARQRARHLSALLGFGEQDQTRIATAVSEIARNAYQYANGGRVDFSIDLQARPQFLWVQVSDRGGGIQDLESVLAGAYVSATGMGLGLMGTRRLMDEFQIASSAMQGTTVRFGKPLPAGAKPVDMADLARTCSTLLQQRAAGAIEELDSQNRMLLQTLDTLRLRESELERRQQDLARLNVELEETNRGVVALYAELDEKAAALRRADEIKSRFLSHVSHEFRTPVNSVLALARLLLMRTDGELSPEQEKQVGYIRDAAQQLADIVNDLLDLAKVESGKTEVRLTRIDTGQFLGATRALMRPLASNEAVSLVFEDLSPSVVFESDESKLGQILRNLISNSLKFTQQGEVRVSAGLSPSGESVVFCVKDTGIGIAPEDQERIFQEFAQIEHPIQERVKGTGLGLPLSRRLAILLGGTLEVESALGTGSVFKLSLPYRAPMGADRAASSENARPTRPKTILLVDDEPTSRYLMHRLLQGTAYQIVEATGSDAAERARFEAPALILLDLAMPDQSGFEVLDQLKSDRVTAGIPVIIHTSKLMTEIDYARLGERISAVLPKGTEDRRPALMAIREILDEPYLFCSEPEFELGI
ncbi:MAG TPA: ATP-binding protein [Bryobacteraceae bacterium]|nr:ATP-binding protein [Bryobacteraceae bacterium]